MRKNYPLMCNCSFVATSVYVQYYTKLHNVQLNMLIFKCDYVEISYLITHHADRNSHNICTITYCVISYKRDNGTWRARRNCILFNVQLVNRGIARMVGRWRYLPYPRGLEFEC
jgi:hypothetical protein